MGGKATVELELGLFDPKNAEAVKEGSVKG